MNSCCPKPGADTGPRRLVLANMDYTPRPGGGHITDEGDQLQQGLFHAGWWAAGHDCHCDNCPGPAYNTTDVPKILEWAKPAVTFVQDFRDWLPGSMGCFNHRVAFQNIDAIKDHPGFKLMPVKDAGNHRPETVEDHRKFAERIGADALVIYWHEGIVRKLQPWAEWLPMIRTYHTVDAETCNAIPMHGERRLGLVSGALNRAVYPLRARAFDHADELGIDAVRHPGYSNRGCATPQFLLKLAGYRVHIATASIYGAALRKIVESVAMGCTPITDLPSYDVLPEIDEALFRIDGGSSVEAIRQAIHDADRDWELGRALHFAEKARRFYDFRAEGKRLDERISTLRAEASDQKKPVSAC